MMTNERYDDEDASRGRGGQTQSDMSAIDKTISTIVSLRKMW